MTPFKKRLATQRKRITARLHPENLISAVPRNADAQNHGAGLSWFIIFAFLLFLYWLFFWKPDA